MPSLVDLLTPESVDALATPANVRLGQELVAADAVEFLEVGPQRVRARVGGAGRGTQRRNIELDVSEGELRWVCTCTGDRRRFCKHLVATALASAGNPPHRPA